MTAFKTSTWGTALLTLAAAGCTPSSNVPGTDLFIDAPDGEYHGPMEVLAVAAGEVALDVGAETTLTVRGTFEDGTDVIVPGDLIQYWDLDNTNVEYGDLENRERVLTARAIGVSHPTALLGSLSGTTEVTVRARVEIETAGFDVPRGWAERVSVAGVVGPGASEDFSQLVEWTSADPAIASVTQDGRIQGKGIGSTTLTATYDGREVGTLSVNVACDYPGDAPSLVRLGATFPKMGWSNAVFPGTTVDGEMPRGELNLQDVHCGREGYEDVKAIFMHVSAEWCQPCKFFRREFNANQAPFRDNNVLPVFMELVDLNNQPNVTSEDANMSIRAELDNNFGVAVGDENTTPERNLLYTSDFLTEWPTFIVIRTRDMRIVAHSQGVGPSALFDNLDAILADPEKNWADLTNGKPFVNNCADGDEEASEPNNRPGEAAPFAFGGTVFGGICEDGGDYFRIEEEGDWRVTLYSNPSEGDIDVFQVDPETGRPLMEGNRVVGTFRTDVEEESFEGRGPAILRVEAKAGGSAKYQMILDPA